MCLCAGIFEVTCRVTTHYSAGMRHQYQVGRCPGRNVTASTPWKATRVVPYFISAEETEWDYFPDSTWELENHPVNRCVCVCVCVYGVYVCVYMHGT